MFSARVRGALLLGGGARDHEPHALVHVQRKTAAVEPRAIRTAELVRRADECGRNRGDSASLDGTRRLARCAGAARGARGEGEHGRNDGGRGLRTLRGELAGSPKNCASC